MDCGNCDGKGWTMETPHYDPYPYFLAAPSPEQTPCPWCGGKGEIDDSP